MTKAATDALRAHAHWLDQKQNQDEAEIVRMSQRIAEARERQAERSQALSEIQVALAVLEPKSLGSSPAKCPDCGHDAHTPRYCVIHDCACGEGAPASRQEGS